MNRYRDWMEQALRDYEKANVDYAHGYYEWACFTCQQAAEKALKALCMFKGLDVWGHSLIEILKILAENDIPVSESINRAARILDKFYIPTRYPNGFASGKPADYYGKEEAMEAIDAAGSIIRWCESHIAEEGKSS